MGSNTFGSIFQVTTFGESHGAAIGAVIDGCPAGLPITKEEIDFDLRRRRPGGKYTSPRKETDECEILSGIFEGKTTGAPIALLIRNVDVDSRSYESTKDLFRPGHANYTYLQKYGLFDYRGGGRSSARETAARVAAGAIAKKLLGHDQIEVCAFASEIGGIAMEKVDCNDVVELKRCTYDSPIFCPDEKVAAAMMRRIEEIREEGDSIGGIVQGIAVNLPPGLGDPVYGKLEALLASAMLSLPASKGFEIGAGFAAAKMRGSEHNDEFDLDEGHAAMKTNFAGGTLGGISTGQPLIFKVAFKPTSSIKKAQRTVSVSREKRVLELPVGSRHDPCVAIRAVPIVEAMLALVLADAMLANRAAKL